VQPEIDLRYGRACCALEGLSIGDAFGGFFEFANPASIALRVARRTLPGAPWHFTDDTMMSLSVLETLRLQGKIDQDRLAHSLSAHYEQSRGYGMSTRHMLTRIARGESWQALNKAVFKGQGSFGNGGAVRAPIVGAYFADDMQQAAEQAQRAAEVTHAHPEALAGAVAAAIAAAWAWRLRSESRRVSSQEFLHLVLPFVPASEVRDGIIKAIELAPGTSVQAAVQVLKNGHNVSAQDTVPFALWAAAQHLGSYEEAIWLVLSGGGDCDTLCALVGGIVVMYSGAEAIPATWRTAREPLPSWAFAQ